MPGDLIPGVLIAFAYLLVPGMGICLSSRATRSRSFVTFLAASTGIGFAAVGAISLALALVGLLRPPPLSIAWVLLSGGSWLVAMGNGSVREAARGWLDRASADPWSHAAAAATLAGFAVVRLSYPPVANMGATAMRYWADALELADAGRIPHRTLQWGELISPATSKSVLNAFNASASILLDRGPLSSMAVLLYVVAIGLAVVVIAALWELGMPRLAPVGALALLANLVTGSELTNDLTRNLAEDWGRLVAFAAVLVAILALRRPHEAEFRRRALRRESRRTVVIAGSLLGIAGGTHLVAASVGAAFVGAFAIAHMVVTRRGAATTLRRALGLGSVALIVGALALTLPPGDLGFSGAAGEPAYDALRSELGLPRSFDPTRFIVTGSGVGDDEPMGVGGVAEAFAYRLAGRNVQVVLPGEELSRWTLILPSAVGVLIVAAVVLWAPRDLRIAAATGGIVTAILFLGGVAFALRYDLFALERFGNRRLFNYALVPYVVVCLAGAEWFLRAIAARGPRAERVVPPFACVAAVAVAIALLPSATWPHEPKRASLQRQVHLLRWIGANVPCEGRILADRRTLGTFEVMSGHAAVLEGMGPHVRPAVLSRAISELIRARTVLEDPSSHLGFLRERGVAAVVTTKSFAEFAGWGRVVKRPPDRFGQVTALRAVYRNSVGIVYLVKDYRPDPTLPAIAGRPGFRCAPGSLRSFRS